MAAGESSRHRRGLTHHRDFRLFWFADTVSLTGNAITRVALPLAAVNTVHASTFQVGLLASAAWVPRLVIGLPAGAWVDRMPRRPVMVISNLGRALAVIAVPLAAALGVLHLWLLYVVALLTGTLGTFVVLAWHSYLPTLVTRDDLIAGNAKLEATASAAKVGGPGVGGVLVQSFGAPFALVADAASFILSALGMSLIRTKETRRGTDGRGRISLLGQINTGVRFVSRHRILRTLVGAVALGSLALAAYQALLIVFLARTVGLSAGLIGALMAAGSAGGVVGAAITTPLSRRVGSARWLWLSTVVAFPFGLLVPLTSPGWGLAAYVVGAGVLAIGVAGFNVTALTFRQTICPQDVLGRVVATTQILTVGAMAVGGLIGGALGSWLGNRPSLWVAVLGVLSVPVWLTLSPIRRMHDLTDARPGAGARSAETQTTAS